MSSYGDGSKYISPTRPRHQVTRSVSETSPQSLTKVHRSSHHHHQHHHPHLHRRDKDEKSSQTTLSKPHSGFSIDGLKSEGVTPNESRNASRRTSVLASATDGLDIVKANIRRPLKDGELDAENAKGVVMATELRNSLTDLNAVSHNTTRHLDNSYYAVLEKLSVLQNHIVLLKQLAFETRQLNEGFDTEAEEVVQEVKAQLNGFEDFETQQKKVENLAQRVHQGRETINTLSTRVDRVKKRVESWEKAEQEWQDKTRKRLKMLWILMSICATILLAIMIASYVPARAQDLGNIKGLNATDLAGVSEIEEALNESGSVTRPVSEGLGKLLGNAKDKVKEERLEDDPRLRVLEEL